MIKKMLERLEVLCQKYTTLSAEDIEILKRIAPRLQWLADRRNEDVFIDCLCKKGSDAIVVAQAKPEHTNYDKYILGFYIHEDAEPAVFRTFRSGISTKNVKAVSYTKTKDHLIAQDVVPIKNGNKTIATIVFERNYHAPHPDVENEVEERNSIPQNIFTPLIENLDDAVIIINQKKQITYLNKKAHLVFKEFGYLENVLNKKYEQVSLNGELTVGPEPRSNYYQNEYYICNNYFRVKEFFHELPDGEKYYEVVIRNITPVKQNEEEARLRLASMREVHHRIKNNLQTIYSLLDLQKRRTSSEITDTILQDAMNRILSISTTYETLLKGHGKTTSLREVIDNLTKNIIRLIDNPLKNININIYGDDIEIDWELSIYIAMVVNELIQNSVKFAFVDRETGEINVHIRKIPIYSKISVSDNGVGFDLNKQKKNLGLQIVENIVTSNLKGKLNVKSGFNGTDVAFSFRIPEVLKYTL